MLEWALVPALMVGAAFVPRPKIKDKKAIELIFKRIGIGVMSENKTPLYPRAGKVFPIFLNGVQIGTTYTYKMPIGLPSTKIAQAEKDNMVFEDALGKPVEVEYKDEYLQIHVYNEKMPQKVLYKDMELKKGWKIPLGRTHKKVIYHDFDLNPHMNIGGTTGFGKTVLLKSLMTSLIESNPDDAKFFIIDMKGGLEFARYEKLKQVVTVAGTAEEAQVMLQFLLQLLMERFELFRSKGWNNIVDTPIKERIFIVVDEGAQLIPEGRGDKVKLECKDILEKIAALGRGIGMRLIFGTQYPTADALPRFIKQNSEVKICFRLPDKYASAVVLGEGNGHAASLPTDVKGRCYYRTHEIFEMQTPLITDREIWERLSQYEESNAIRKETPTTGGDITKFRGDEVRDKGATATKKQTRNRPKRAQSPGRNERVPASENPRREEHLLPRRKGKGFGRSRE